jgi:hypothetical protein
MLNCDRGRMAPAARTMVKMASLALVAFAAGCGDGASPVIPKGPDGVLPSGLLVLHTIAGAMLPDTLPINLPVISVSAATMTLSGFQYTVFGTGTTSGSSSDPLADNGTVEQNGDLLTFHSATRHHDSFSGFITFTGIVILLPAKLVRGYDYDQLGDPDDTFALDFTAPK